MILSDEEARAASDIAVTVGKSVDALSGFGKFLEKTVGNIPADLIGIAGGDWLHQKRERCLAEMLAKTARLLENIALERRTEPTPAFVQPLLQYAKDESRDVLQDLWAALLANALVDNGARVRRDFFDAVAKMEPNDARLLEAYERLPRAQTMTDMQDRQNALIAEIARLKLDPIDISISAKSLQQLGCLVTHPLVGSTFKISDFGIGLLRAVHVA